MAGTTVLPSTVIGFPHGGQATSTKIAESKQAIADALKGAKRGHVLQEHDKETGQQSLALFNPQNDPDSPGEQAKLEQYDKLGGGISDKLSERLRLRAQVHESPNPKH